MRCPWCGKEAKVELQDQRNIIMTNGKPYPFPWGYKARCPDMICGWMGGASYLPDELKAGMIENYLETIG